MESVCKRKMNDFTVHFYQENLVFSDNNQIPYNQLFEFKSYNQLFEFKSYNLLFEFKSYNQLFEFKSYNLLF